MKPKYICHIELSVPAGFMSRQSNLLPPALVSLTAGVEILLETEMDNDTYIAIQAGDADKRKGLMSMEYKDFAGLMADVDRVFNTWDKVCFHVISVRTFVYPDRGGYTQLLSEVASKIESKFSCVHS